MRFHTTLLLGGKTATGIRVPDDIVAALGAGKKPAVRVTIGSHTYRSTIAVMGGQFMLPVSAENRNAAGLSVGDELDVEIELDTEPRVLEVPDDLRAALSGDADASRNFAGLSYSNRRRWVMSVDDAKTPETRQRRIAKAVATLREG